MAAVPQSSRLTRLAARRRDSQDARPGRQLWRAVSARSWGWVCARAQANRRTKASASVPPRPPIPTLSTTTRRKLLAKGSAARRCGAGQTMVASNEVVPCFARRAHGRPGSGLRSTGRRPGRHRGGLRAGVQPVVRVAWFLKAWLPQLSAFVLLCFAPIRAGAGAAAQLSFAESLEGARHLGCRFLVACPSLGAGPRHPLTVPASSCPGHPMGAWARAAAQKREKNKTLQSCRDMGVDKRHAQNDRIKYIIR